MQQSVGRTAFGAIAADFQPAHEDVELAFALDLTFEPVEQIAFKFSNLSTSQARHMNVIALWPALIKVLLALHVHQVKLINEPVSL
jgi:hypothetical protein